MSKFGDQTHCEILGCIDLFEIGQAGYLLNYPRILMKVERIAEDSLGAFYNTFNLH